MDERSESVAVVWEDPPALTHGHGKGTGKWHRLLAPLMEHPGKWANLGEHNRNVGANITRGLLAKGLGRFQGTMRHIDVTTGLGTLYVRYLGPDEADDSASRDGSDG